MENTYQGDLADVVRASGGAISPEAPILKSDWQFPSIGIEEPTYDFGDPFSITGDPLLHDSDTLPVPVSGFLDTGNTEVLTAGGGGGGGGNNNILDDNRKRPSNIFSRLQMSPNSKFSLSPCDSPLGLKAAAPLLVSNDHRISQNNFESCLLESPTVQISSPRNPGIKRR